jgi:hypothetical protein
MNTSQVCMPSNHFVLVVIVGISVIFFALWQVNKQAHQIQLLTATKNNDIDNISQNLDEMIEQKIKSNLPGKNNDKQDQIIKLLMAANENQRDQDYQRMVNPFIPPLQRGPFSPMLAEKTLPINSPTHGEYGNFQSVGYAYKPTNPDQMFQLFGRRIYSNKYEYYVIHPFTQIKIPVRVKNDWELSRDDKIIINGFPGDFIVEIYDLDQPRYVPY